MSIRPEDILPDGKDALEIKGITARKGTIATAMANAAIMGSAIASKEEKYAAKLMIQELAPVLVALGVHQHFAWRNPEIEAIMESVKHEAD